MKLNSFANRTFWLLGWLIVAMPAHAFYDPSLGRWLNRDPIEEEGGINLHTYVSNNPINKADSWGWSDFNAPPVSISPPDPPRPPLPPRPPGHASKCADGAAKVYKDCLDKITDKLCLKNIYDRLDNALKTCEYGMCMTDNPFVKGIAYGEGLLVRGLMLGEGAFYGGAAAGCAAQAAGYMAACMTH